MDSSPTSRIVKTLNDDMVKEETGNQNCCCPGKFGFNADDMPSIRNKKDYATPVERVSPILEPERVLGIYEPVRVMQCCNCACFYLEGAERECCPECDSRDAEEFGKVVPNRDEVTPDREPEVNEESDELDLDLDESIDLLESRRLREFNRKFGDKAKVRGRNLYLISEGIRSRNQLLTRDQLKAYKLSKYYNR